MRLSEININPIWNATKKNYDNEKLTSEQISKIVFSDIFDDKKSGRVAIVMGTSRKIEMEARVKKASELYHKKRIQKILFTGGKNGISSAKKNQTPQEIQEENQRISCLLKDNDSEANRMKKYALTLHVKESDIRLDEISNNSNETWKNILNFEDFQEGENLIIISSAYHLKRCLASALKYVPVPLTFSLVSAPTGYFEESNYQNTSLGKEIINFEANHLVRLAKEHQIYDLRLSELPKKRVRK